MSAALGRRLPEQRLFLKSDTSTRFVRVSPVTQAVALGGAGLVLIWTIVASSILFMDAIGSGTVREQVRRAQEVYAARLDALSRERDLRAAEVAAAQARVSTALRQISSMQSSLLTSEERRRELETGIGVIQATLRRTMNDRDAARAALDAGRALAAGDAPPGETVAPGDLTATVDFLTLALARSADALDAARKRAADATTAAEETAYELRLTTERNDRILSRLEDAVTVSMAPLDKMFTAAGLDPDALLAEVRRGYSGQGGPLMPVMPTSVSTKGESAALADPATMRASSILNGLDRMNLYRIASEKVPFVLPLRTAFRMTSAFGQRWGRLHAGLDLAGSYGSPVYSTAEGVVISAGWDGGYGKSVTIRHAFGIETRYAHLSDIRVKAGQRVSRGDRIGDMGNSGNSTGTHVHYEVRVSDDPVNPMTFIKAANDVL